MSEITFKSAMLALPMRSLDFIRESNAIEGIHREPLASEIAAHQKFWLLEKISIDDLVEFVTTILYPPFTSSPLRAKPGMDVYIGRYVPPKGGEAVPLRLAAIIASMIVYDPYHTHRDYESLHPFMDGNGRSGRALWAWHMMEIGRDPFAMPFLQRWYYDSLSQSR